MTCEPLEIDRNIRRKKHIEAVAAAIAFVQPNVAQLLARLNQSFAEQKSRREFIVIPRRAHRDDERARVDSDFQRLFDGEFVKAAALPSFSPAHDLLARRLHALDFSTRTVAL